MPPNKVRPPAEHRRAEGDGFNVNSILPPAAAESGLLRALLEEIRHESRVPLSAITVLARQNDPFRFDTPVGHRDEEWLVRTTADLGLGDHTIHLRRLHYMIIGETKPDGSRYTNTDKGWMWKLRFERRTLLGILTRWPHIGRFDDEPVLTNVIPGCFVSSTAATQTMPGRYMNYHVRFNIVESSLAAGVKTAVRIVLDMASVG